VIKCYSPELIVHPYLPDSWQSQQQQQQQQGQQQGQQQQQGGLPEQQQRLQREAVVAIEPWLDRFDAVVVGPGLGRDPLTLATVAEVTRVPAIPIRASACLRAAWLWYPGICSNCWVAWKAVGAVCAGQLSCLPAFLPARLAKALYNSNSSRSSFNLAMA